MRKILYSPDYGAGWTTWNKKEVAQIMVDYPPVIEAVERGERITENHPAIVQMIAYIRERLSLPEEDYICVLGADELKVKEVEGRVRIQEYDGAESVEEEEKWADDWL